MASKNDRKKAAVAAIKACGGASELARFLNKGKRKADQLTPQAVSNWASRGRIPMEYIEAIADHAGLMPNDVDPCVPVVIIEDQGPTHGDPGEQPDPNPVLQESRPRRKREPVPVLAEPTGREALPDFVTVDDSEE